MGQERKEDRDHWMINTDKRMKQQFQAIVVKWFDIYKHISITEINSVIHFMLNKWLTNNVLTKHMLEEFSVKWVKFALNIFIKAILNSTITLVWLFLEDKRSVTRDLCPIRCLCLSFCWSLTHKHTHTPQCFYWIAVAVRHKDVYIWCEKDRGK